MPEMLLTVEQAAARLQLHAVTIRRQIERGELRAIRRGRSVRIPESALTEESPARTREVTLETGTVSDQGSRSIEAMALVLFNGLKNPDWRSRNETIIALSSAAESTRDLVEAMVTRELASIPDDADFSDWNAIQGADFSFPDEDKDFLASVTELGNESARSKAP